MTSVDPEEVADGERQWGSEPTWGMWGIPVPGLLPDDMSGMDAIELGCGTAYVSAWIARHVLGTANADGFRRSLDKPANV